MFFKAALFSSIRRNSNKPSTILKQTKESSELEHREEMRHVISIKVCSAYTNKEGTYDIFKRPAPKSLYFYVLYTLTCVFIYFLSCPYMKYSNLL